MSELVRSNDSSWNLCPSEIWIQIFKHLDAKSLIHCSLVNRRWKEIAEYICENFLGWQTLVEQGLEFDTQCYVIKSTLDWKQIYVNSQLWYNVRCANIDVVNVDECDNIIQLSVFQELLVVIHGAGRKYYYFEQHRYSRNHPEPQYLDIQENDSIMVQLCQDGEHKTLKMWGKLCMVENVSLKPSRCIQREVKVFKLEGNRCYFVDLKNILYYYKWAPKRWIKRVIARYYGDDNSIRGIHIHQDEMYILLKSGNVLRAFNEGKHFEVAIHLNIPDHIPEIFFMFNKFSLIFREAGDENCKMNIYSNGEDLLLGCPGLTCVTQHGDVLFLGYEYGKVDICILKYWYKNHEEFRHTYTIPQADENDHYKGELRIDLNEFDKDGDHHVVAVDVYENAGFHTLFVATTGKVYRLSITYPLAVREMI